MKEKTGSRRALALTLTALLLLSLIPILLAGDCAHPYGDDYAYSRYVHRALEEGGSVLSALGCTVKQYYLGWQGAYAATALMALQPGLISEQAYVLTPILLLCALCLSTAAFTHAVLCRWLKQDRWTWLAVTAGLLAATIQFQPYIREAFMLWRAGVYYIGFYALMLLLFTCLIRLRLDPRHPAALFVAALLLAALVGGGNYVTGLLSCLVLGGYTLACAVWDRKRLWQPAVTGAVLLTGFLISVFAPGNGVRQSAAEGMGVLESIGAAIAEGQEQVHAYMHLPFLALMLGLVPVLWRALENTDFTFPLPGVATAVLFLTLCCQNVPHFYALASVGPGRLRNIVYDSYLLLLLVAEGYWLGWLRRRKGGDFLSVNLGRGMVKTALFAAVAGFLLSYPLTPVYQCSRILADGTARAYDAHMNGWVSALSDPDTDPVTVTQPPVCPPLLYGYNLVEDPYNFANTSAAGYYGKTWITALPAEEA